MELAIGQYPIPSIDPVDFVRAFAPDQETNMLEHFRAAKTGELLPGKWNKFSFVLFICFHLVIYKSLYEIFFPNLLLIIDVVFFIIVNQFSTVSLLNIQIQNDLGLYYNIKI